MTRMILISLLLAGLGQAQTITTTWADQSIIGVVTNNGAGYTWTAVISTLGPAVPNGAPAVPTPPLQAAAEPSAPTSLMTYPVITQSAPPPPPSEPAVVTVVPQQGTVQAMGDYQSSLDGELKKLGSQAFQAFTSKANIQGLSIPQFGAASVSALPSAALLSVVAGLAVGPILLGLASI